MVWKRLVGLKPVEALTLGKPGIVGLTKPLMITDRLFGFDFDVGLLIVAI